MVARILIVIVVVAVLGFFGTRGSEKVVQEVTERRESVDAVRADLEATKRELQALKDEATKRRTADDAAVQELQRTVLDLGSKIGEMQRERGALLRFSVVQDKAARGEKTKDVVASIDGVELSKHDLLHGRYVTIGDHDLELRVNQQRARYRLAVTSAEPAMLSLNVGNAPKTTDNITLTPAP